MEINNSNVTATNGILSFSNGVTLTNCYVKSGKQSSTYISGNPVEIAKRTKPAVKYYGIHIGGRSVTSENADDIYGDGKFSFNASANTLTIDGAAR